MGWKEYRGTPTLTTVGRNSNLSTLLKLREKKKKKIHTKLKLSQRNQIKCNSCYAK